MRRVALIGIVALLVVGLAWWFVQRPHPRAQTASESIPQIDAASPVAEPNLEAVEPQANRSEVAIAVASNTEPPSAEVSERAERLGLHGTVVVMDEKGGEHPHESGTLGLRIWNDKESISTDVEVVAGCWRLHLDRCEQVSVVSARLGGRDAYDDLISTHRNVSMSRGVDFRLAWASVLTLHARDASSNLDLGAIEVVTGNEGGGVVGFDSPRAPERISGEGVLNLRGASPLAILPEQLAAAPYAGVLYVRAAGYAWSRVEFDRKVGGDVFVEMAPAASLDVYIDGSVSEQQASIRLYPLPRGRPVYVTYVGNRTQFLIDDLSAADYRLAVEVGEWVRNPTVLAETEVTVATGAHVHVRLPVGTQSRTELATLSGTLRIPTAWDTQRPGVSASKVDRRDTPSKTKLSATLGPGASASSHVDYPWRIEAATVGRYMLASEDPPFVLMADLEPRGTANVVIEVPPPGTVIVHLVDAETKESVAVDRLMWRAKRSNASFPISSGNVTRTAPSDTFEFKCPIGDIEINLFGFGGVYANPRTSVCVAAGDNAVTIPLLKVMGIAITIVDGGRSLPAREPRAFDISSVAEGQKPNSWTAGGSTTTAHVSKPGQYRIKLKDPIAGYLLPDEQIVDLAPGTTTDVVIRLTRKP